MKRPYFCIISLTIGVMGLAVTAFAQTVQLNMSVEPEISAEVLRDLNFGRYLVDSGDHYISEDSPGTGIFRIKGLAGQQILVSLTTPDYLAHTTLGSQERIPVGLQASYNRGRNDPGTSLSVKNNQSAFSLSNTNTQADDFWAFAYLYIFGTITIGDVADGHYSGKVILTVEYQ